MSPATFGPARFTHSVLSFSSNKHQANIFNTLVWRNVQLMPAQHACVFIWVWLHPCSGCYSSASRAQLPWEALSALSVLDHPSLLGSPGILTKHMPDKLLTWITLSPSEGMNLAALWFHGTFPHGALFFPTYILGISEGGILFWTEFCPKWSDRDHN